MEWVKNRHLDTDPQFLIGRVCPRALTHSHQDADGGVAQLPRGAGVVAGVGVASPRYGQGGGRSLSGYMEGRAGQQARVVLVPPDVPDGQSGR